MYLTKLISLQVKCLGSAILCYTQVQIKSCLEFRLINCHFGFLKKNNKRIQRVSVRNGCHGTTPTPSTLPGLPGDTYSTTWQLGGGGGD